jgi:hypothetical protein
MSIKYHGNYCGPGWSGGKYQPSVAAGVAPVKGKPHLRGAAANDFDKSCAVHDRAYANHRDSPRKLTQADDVFYNTNIGKGVVRTTAALAVMSNRLGRKGNTRVRGASNIPQLKPSPKDTKPQSGPHDLFLQQTRQKNISTHSKIPNTKTKMPRKYRANNTVSRAAVATSKTVRIPKPKFNGGNTTTVTHREYVGQVNSSTSSAIASFQVNPGLGSLFGWLTEVANGYEEYRFKKLTFNYVSAAATSERGRVALAFQYDPTADSPVTKAALFSIVPNVEEAPWEDIELRVPTSSEWKYVRSGSLNSGSFNTYDTGKLHVLTAMNADSTTQLGEVFVDYIVELKNPQFHQISAGEYRAVGQSAASPMGTSTFLKISGQPVITWRSITSLYINTNKPLMLNFRFVGTVMAQTSPVYTQTTGSQGALSVKYNIIEVGALQQGMCISINNAQRGDYISFGASESATLTTALIYQSMYISQ